MNQHYVPKAYLKNFSFKCGKGSFVDVFDKEKERYFKTNIKNICSEVDLYTLEEGTKVAKDLFVVEKIYSNGLEPLYLKAYQILTNNNIFHISDLQRVEMLIGIFQLYLRNPRFIKRSISFHNHEILRRCKEAKEKGIKGITYLEEDFSFSEFQEEDIIKFFKDKITNEFKEKHLGGVGEMGEFHQNAIFEVSVIKDDAEFITSDNPLITEDLLTKDEHPLLRSKEFIITLNKKMALRLYHDKTKYINRIYRYHIPNGSVATINKAIIDQSSRFVIASKSVLDEHFRICKDFLDNTSLKLKMDTVRQVLSFPAPSKYAEASKEVMRYYLNKYETEGSLSEQEEYEMHIKTRQLLHEFLKNRIS